MVRIGDFVGVVAEREENAIKAAAQLKVSWKPTPTLPDLKDVETALRANPSTPRTLIDKGDVDAAIAAAAKPMPRTYVWPYQMHGSIGPSCAVADVPRRMTSGCGRARKTRTCCAPTSRCCCRRPEAEIEVIRMEAAGCYGRNCADDVIGRRGAAVARGRPSGPRAIDPRAGARLGAQGHRAIDGRQGRIARRRQRRRLRFCHALSVERRADPGAAADRQIAPVPAVFEMGDRTAIPPYDYDHMRVVAHDMPPIVRASWLRGVSALPNTFAHESYIDELATEAGVDPIEYRLRYLKDPRAVDLVHAVAERAGWTPRPVWQAAGGRGRHRARTRLCLCALCAQQISRLWRGMVGLGRRRRRQQGDRRRQRRPAWSPARIPA